MRSTACSAKSFEELVYGHSYESELGELRKLVSDYKPKEAKKKERGGGRAASSTAAGKKREKGSDEMVMGAMSPVARQSSAASVSSRSLLMPLYSQYPAATTPVSASRYETAYGGSTASMPPRRKSLDANMLYGPQAGSHTHVSHHTHSSSAFVSPSPSSFYAPPAASSGYHDGESNSSYPLSSSLTPSHGGMRHRPNFASAAAAAAAAADSVVAYVASTPTSAVMNGGWGGGLHSPKTTQRETSASAFSFAPPAVAAAPLASAAALTSSLHPSSSSPSGFTLLAQPSSSPPSSRASLLHSPSQSSSLAVATTLAPVTLASIKTSPPQSTLKLSSAAALTALAPPTLSSASSSSSAVTPRPGSHASSDPQSRSSSRSNTPQPASPALAPPRPTILIPNSPLTTDAAEDGGLNVTGGSDVVKSTGEGEHDEEDNEVSRRAAQEEKVEKKRRKKDRREERRLSDRVKQQHEDEEGIEAEKAASEHSDRPARGVMSWRRQADAEKEEKKETPLDEPKPSIAEGVTAADAAAAPMAASFATVAPSAAAERELPFADVTPPPTIDFPAYSVSAVAVATPLASLVRRAGASCALFTLVRLYVAYVSPAATTIDHFTALMLFVTTIIAAFFLLTTLPSPLSHKPASAAPTSSLSSELSRYLQAWDLIALDDPQQLLAAYSMTQQMLLSLLHALQPVSASSSPSPSMSPASLVSHAQSVLAFLDVAHQHLYSDSGYTLLLDRLLAATATVRHLIQQLSSSLTQRPSAHAAASSLGVLLQLVSGCCLIAYVVLPCPVLRWSVTSVVVHLLLPATLIALEILGLFVVLDAEQRLQPINVGMGAAEVEGLLELRQRMDKRMEALMLIAHTADSD